VERAYRENEITVFVADTDSSTNAERQNAAARLTSYIDQQFKYGNFKLAIQASRPSLKSSFRANTIAI